jgi:Cryptococcal mannosyltransferase 1
MPKENNKSGMLLRFRRMSRLRLKLFLAFCALASFLEIICLRWSFLSSLDSSLAPQFGRQRIFVASTHWNNEAIIRSHWNAAILELVREIGIKSIYISIYESGSWDDSKGALRELDFELERLGVSKTIILDQTTHIDEIEKPPAASGWVDTPRGKKELRRIPYLSKLRNLSLKPLRDLEKSGQKFDYVLFLSDVVFKVSQTRFPHYGPGVNGSD